MAKQLSAGVYYATNPHPLTGVFLTPTALQKRVKEVRPTGLLRSDVIFIEAALFCLQQGWRESANFNGRQTAEQSDRGQPKKK